MIICTLEAWGMREEDEGVKVLFIVEKWRRHGKRLPTEIDYCN